MFFEYLNSCHPNVKFTMETEDKDQLPFLDVLLSTQLISESYNNSHNRVKITPQGGVTIFGVNITPKRSYFFL